MSDVQSQVTKDHGRRNRNRLQTQISNQWSNRLRLSRLYITLINLRYTHTHNIFPNGISILSLTYTFPFTHEKHGDTPFPIYNYAVTRYIVTNFLFTLIYFIHNSALYFYSTTRPFDPFTLTSALRLHFIPILVTFPNTLFEQGF